MDKELPGSKASLKIGDVMLTTTGCIVIISEVSNSQGRDNNTFPPMYAIGALKGSCKHAWYNKEEFSELLELNYRDRMLSYEEKQR